MEKIREILNFFFNKKEVQSPEDPISPATEVIPPTMEEIKKNFAAEWQQSVEKFRELFPEFMKAVDFYGGTLTGSMVYKRRPYNVDVDILFTSSEEMQAFWSGMEESPFFKKKGQPTAWETKREWYPGGSGPYIGEVPAGWVEIKNPIEFCDGILLSHGSGSTNYSWWVDTRVVEKIIPPEELVEKSKKTGKYFQEVFLNLRKKSYTMKIVGCAHGRKKVFRNGKWVFPLQEMYRKVNVWSIEEAEQKIEDARKDFVSIEKITYTPY